MNINILKNLKRNFKITKIPVFSIYAVLSLFSFFCFKPNIANSETIRDAIRKVLENSPEMKIVGYDKRISEYDKKISISSFFPTINFDTIFSGSTLRRDINGAPIQKTSTKSGEMRLGLSYVFFDSGGKILQQKITDLSYASQCLVEDSKKREMIYEAVNAYIGVLETSLIQKMYKKTVQSAKTSLDLAKEKFQLGSYSKRELADIASKYSNTFSQYIQYESDRDNAFVKYQNLIGETPVIQNFEQPTEVFNPTTLVTPLEKAMKYNPSANQANLTKRITNLQQKQTFSSQHLPTASLVSTWKFRQSNNDYFDFNKKNDTSFSVDFQIPLFNGLYGVYNVKKANLKALQSEEYRVKVLRDINTTVSDVWYQLKKSHSVAIAKKDEVEANLLQVEATKSERKVGRQTDLDVLDAEIEWIESKVDLIRAEYNSVRLSYRLLLLVGEETDLSELY